jgi:hypothetical protein
MATSLAGLRESTESVNPPRMSTVTGVDTVSVPCWSSKALATRVCVPARPRVSQKEV